jgi:hypothetical protein
VQFSFKRLTDAALVVQFTVEPARPCGPLFEFPV